jgi:CubicO group peptidase (beta-lactamase class C family)
MALSESTGKPLAKSKPTAMDAARYASAGGFHTTATDFAKFLIEILEPKPGDAFRLSRSSPKEMVRPQVKLAENEKIDGASSWALGWAIQERRTGNVLVHSGGQAGFRSLAMASVERKSGFIIPTNSDSGGQIVSHRAFADTMNRLLTG